MLAGSPWVQRPASRIDLLQVEGGGAAGPAVSALVAWLLLRRISSLLQHCLHVQKLRCWVAAALELLPGQGAGGRGGCAGHQVWLL